MMTQAHQDIVDHADFCRACRGRGGEYEDNGYGGRIFEPCYLCGGNGFRTVRIYEPKVAS